MTWHFTPFVLPLAAAAGISGGVAAYGWRHRDARGSRSLTLMMAAVAEWCLTSALQLSGSDLPTKLFWSKAEYLGIVVIPLAWLGFAIEYTGRERVLTRRALALLAVVPTLTLLLVFTTEYHGLFWSSLRFDPGPLPAMRVGRGPWFWVSVAYSYALLLAGTVLLVPKVLRSPAVYRGQAVAVLSGLAVPWVSNALFIFGPPLPHDPTPFTLTLSGLAFAWGLFRFRLLDVVPVARDAVIEGMTDGMMVLDARSRVVDLNPAAQRILGCTASEAVGRTAAEVLRAWPELVERYRDVLEERGEITIAEGASLRNYELRLSPLVDGRGRVTGRLVVWRDVTERKRAEAELRGQKRLFENLLAVARATTERPTLEATLHNTLDVASSLTGAEGASLFLLDEAGTVTHSIVAEGRVPIPHSPDFVGPIMDMGVAGWVARHRRAGLIHDTLGDDRWLKLPDQDLPIRSALAVPISSGSTLVGILTLVHGEPGHFDASDLAFIQAAADQMALALRNAQIFDAGSRMADRQTTLYEVLRAVGGELDPDRVARVAVEVIAQRTGWPNVVIALPDLESEEWTFQAVARQELLIGRLPLRGGVIGRAHSTGRTQLVADVTADPDYVAGLPVVRSELAVPIRRGEKKLGILNLENDAVGAFGPEDVLMAESLADAVALALDNAGLYREIAAKHQRLQDLERMRDDLTHTMVHDLRNPLTSVSGVLEAIDLTAAHVLNSNQLGMVKLARAGAERMSALVDAILEVSRLESGHVPLVLQSLALGPLVAETLSLQARLAEEKRLRIGSEVPPAHPPAWADPALVGRVLQNLVGNAVKFTPEGGSIRITADVEPSQPPMLRVSVSDTGPGVPAEIRGRLFQKFVTGGQKGQGSGLGLAFCRLAVEAHGGRIWVESEPGQGSTFSFTLPPAA